MVKSILPFIPCDASSYFKLLTRSWKQGMFDIIIVPKIESKNVNVCEIEQQMKYDKTEGPRECTVKLLWHF